MGDFCGTNAPRTPPLRAHRLRQDLLSVDGTIDKIPPTWRCRGNLWSLSEAMQFGPQGSPKHLLFGGDPGQPPSVVLEQTQVGVNPNLPGEVLNQKIFPPWKTQWMIHGKTDYAYHDW